LEKRLGNKTPLKMFNLKKYRQFLTKNERNRIYLRKNTAEGRAIADSKYRTKIRLQKGGVGVPKLIKRFKTVEKLEAFRWEDLEGNFVVKPASGYGGEGIIIVRKKRRMGGGMGKDGRRNGNC